jgi:selenide, water dikinase
LLEKVDHLTYHLDEFLIPNFAKEGDIIVLTKPLGTQICVNLKEWKSTNDFKYEDSKKFISDKDIEEMSDLSIQSMGKLNKNAASLVLKYKAGACTDVTGFGILGHLENLAEAQKDKHLELKINALPVIKNSDLVEKNIMNFKLLKGYSAETSGGLMCILNEKYVDNFQKDLQNQFGEKSWVIGEVIRTKEKSRAVIKDKPEIIQADAVFC